MEHKKETSPDELLDTFKGSSLKMIIIVTVIVHVVLLFGTSLPSLLMGKSGGNVEDMSESERMEKAVEEANKSIKELAEEWQVKPQDLSAELGIGAPRPTSPKAAPAPSPVAGGPSENPEESKSSIEKEMEKVEKGPAVPAVPEDDEEDLFK